MIIKNKNKNTKLLSKAKLKATTFYIFLKKTVTQKKFSKIILMQRNTTHVTQKYYSYINQNQPQLQLQKRLWPTGGARA